MADEEAKRLETPNGKAKQINILWTNIIGGAETKANWVSKSRTSQPASQSVTVAVPRELAKPNSVRRNSAEIMDSSK